MKKILFFLISFVFIVIPALSEEPELLPSETGIVEKVLYIDTPDDVSQTKQLVTVKILSGKYKGERIELDNILSGNPYYDIQLKNNMKVILHAEDNGDGTEFSIEDVNRANVLLMLAIIFCTLLIYVGRKKGLYSLVSIAITLVLITHCLIPLIMHGINPLIGVILVCILSTIATMYLVGGFNAKSTSASIGVTLSLIFAAILSAVTMNIAHLTGFTAEYSVFLYNMHPEFNFVNIAIAAMILAALGAVMDVAMSISSTINEIYQTDNTKTIKELFKSGMNVGRDIIGTMANTLILVYLGGSLSLLLLSGNIDVMKFINLNQVVTEIASALIGSISIVICVPFTAIVASWLIHTYAKKAENDFDITIE